MRNALEAYQSVHRNTSSSRELEAAVLFKAARRLEDCVQQWDTEGHDIRLDEALRYNLRLWTFFQTELGEPNHPLPIEIRRNLLQLSGFVDRQTFSAMAAPAREKLPPLININRNIAAGLSQTPAPEPALSAAS
jgi:flagellar protein FlaF